VNTGDGEARGCIALTSALCAETSAYLRRAFSDSSVRVDSRL
jgi:hypothetical protein